ncbi:GNAT family N-acetyltransferase, partial [Candidatus Bathyarchaeota archaeon]|nr:GNAT family N-acetyltransferase [Candidatus Bathyarchaeota archaeon]
KDGIVPVPENIKICKQEYDASEGTELFISVEDRINNILIGYIRLRIPSERAHRPEINHVKSSIVRALHVYGSLVPVGEHFEKAWQHKGYGTLLLSEAERISLEEFNCEKILVTSGLGAKEYYKRVGYDYDGPYVSKFL